jgi:hypothetical protein
MTFAEMAQAINGYFHSVKPTGLTVLYDNAPDKRPQDGSTWCRFHVIDGDTFRVTVGVAEYRTVGAAVAQLFGRVGEGTSTLRGMADAIADAFKDQTHDGINYRVPSVRNIGITDGMYQINVVIPYYVNSVG